MSADQIFDDFELDDLNTFLEGAKTFRENASHVYGADEEKADAARRVELYGRLISELDKRIAAKQGA